MQIMKWDFSNYFNSNFWTAFFLRSKKVNYSAVKASRIALAAARGFKDDECASKASSLTFYSLLSIVPVLAVAFGIAKGFGFQERLESELAERFVEQKEVVDKLIYFSYQTLQNTESGLIAGVGLIVLFWSVLKLFSNIESSFNAIWKVKKARSFARSFSDYLAMMLFCPIFFAASSSLSVFVVTRITDFTKTTGMWNAISPIAYMAFHLFPYLLAWLLFTALYSIMPNTKVPLKYAFIAGICAGTAYQIVQSVYIHFQIGLASYGAIYGSFAALPLFLIWLNTSWLIALGGAEIACHAENDRFSYALSSAKSQLQVDARVLGILVMQQCARAFFSGISPPSVYNLAQNTGVPVVSIRHIIQQLINAGLLIEVNWRGNSGEFYQPSRDLKKISLKAICDSLDSSRQDFYLMVYNDDVKRYEEVLISMDQLLESAPINSTIDQLFLISDNKDSRNG
jgi:membrane protein